MRKPALQAVLALAATTLAVAGEADVCKDRWSLGGVFPGMSSAELLARVPGVSVSNGSSEPTSISAPVMIGGRTVETQMGICIDEQGEVSLVRASFSSEQFDLKAIHDWLRERYGPPLSLGVMDAVAGGEWTGYRRYIVFDHCFRNGLISAANGPKGTSALSVALIRGLPPYVSISSEGGVEIDHKILEKTAWKYVSCRKRAQEP